ncbi:MULTISPECIES: hypothetical protein [Paenibacillus]|uniref:hypothetical protein n=1 Tax=Paenibacillus TaxID=44249 RepID=UPI00049220FD|nr:hypothetical protein [Paenibacillus sp. IHBB 10380]
MERFLKPVKMIWMLLLVLITAFALYIPVQEYYTDETVDERYVYKHSMHPKAAALKHSQILSKLKVAGSSKSVFFMLSAVLMQRIPKIRLPYRPIIPRRLRLMVLFPIKYTSVYVSRPSRFAV